MSGWFNRVLCKSWNLTSFVDFFLSTFRWRLKALRILFSIFQFNVINVESYPGCICNETLAEIFIIISNKIVVVVSVSTSIPFFEAWFKVHCLHATQCKQRGGKIFSINCVKAFHSSKVYFKVSSWKLWLF